MRVLRTLIAFPLGNSGILAVAFEGRAANGPVLQESCLPGVRHPTGKDSIKVGGKVSKLSLMTWWTKRGDVFVDHTG